MSPLLHYGLCISHSLSESIKEITMKCLFCDTPATSVIELAGFFKQNICDRHATYLIKIVKPEYFYGLEEIS